jgi:hypothetical protein
MTRRSRGRLATVVPVLIAVVGGLVSGSAMARLTSAACDARAGTTVLKDTQARVFERHAVYYACSLTTGRGQELSGPKSWLDRGDGFELAGSYVAWAQDPSPYVSDQLRLLDVDRGPVRTIFPGQAQGETTSSWVQSYLVNRRGTVVWLYDGTGGGVVGSPYYAFSEVLDSRNHRALGAASSHGSSPQTPAISSLGLSTDGKFAFWVQKGKPRGAQIPR